jgi:signal transduction histidine kinase
MWDGTEEIQHLLEAERTISRISSSLITTEAEHLAEAVRSALAELGQLFGVDRAYLMAFGGQQRIALAEEWCAPHIDTLATDIEGLSGATWEWWTSRLAAAEAVVVSPPDGLDGAPDEVRSLLETEKVGTLLLIPVTLSSQVTGVMALTSVGRRAEPSPEAITLLTQVAESFVNRIERAHAERALERLTQELALRNSELMRSNRELEDFAYVASHDLRSPLMIVQGYLDVLTRTKDHLLDDEARTYIAAAVAGSARLTQLIDELLMYSRAGQPPREFEPLELRALVRAVLAEHVRLDETYASVEVRELPLVRGDKLMLRQLFQNLLSNAFKFVANGTTPFVVIGSDTEEEPPVIWVSDNGVGIPPADRERVFQMFTRLDRSRDRAGSGIGLAVCHRVVHAHGGDIWIDDAEGGGSRFCFTLPTP